MLQLDITGTLAKMITPSLGIPENDLATIKNTLKSYVEDFLKERSAGNHAWAMSPYDREVLGLVEDTAARLKRERIETIVWVGSEARDLGRVLLRKYSRPQKHQSSSLWIRWIPQ